MNVKKQYNIWGIGNGADNYIDERYNLSAILKLIYSPFLNITNT
jgi:hypothetical protein